MNNKICTDDNNNNGICISAPLKKIEFGLIDNSA